jgi:hypothetical protein
MDVPFRRRIARAITIALASLAISLVASAWIAWPAPRYLHDGIVYSPQGQTGEPRYAVAGDHLQLLYHFWLFSDFLGGETPWFHNLYEFNTGDDSATRKVHAYYFPFSFFYSIGRAVSSQAFGWNLAGFLSVWLAYLGAWRLARCYVAREAHAALAALPALLLPYRWVVLMGGSPTGFAILFVPWVLLAVDRALREGRWGAGLAAGLLIYGSGWSDTHLFFFSFLAAPVWAAWTWIATAGTRPCFWYGPAVRRAFRGLIPTVFVMALSFVQVRQVQRSVEDTGTSEGWKPGEIALFSPRASGLWSWDPNPHSGLIYLGASVALLALVGLVVAVLAFRNRRVEETTSGQDEGAYGLSPDRWTALALVLLILGAAGVALLALGPRTPLGGDRFWSRFVRLIPPYAMIRQPAKVFVLMPSVLSVVAAMSFALARRHVSRTAVWGCAALWVGLMAVEYPRRFSPSICRLETGQPAYAAVAADADRAGTPARILALPLWPGNSHWTSVNQYYASLHRVRMVNGYRPSVPRAYLEGVFEVFNPLNQGWLTDAHLARLESMGVGYLVLHEDAFPERVSPFPVGRTLEALLSHPRLDLLEQSRSVWAFRIRPQPREVVAVDLTGGYLFPSRRWPFRPVPDHSAERIRDPDAVDGSYLALRGPNPGWIPPYAAAPAPGLRWMVRARSTGPVTFAWADQEDARDIGPEWSWFDLPMGDSAEVRPMSLTARLDDPSHQADLDAAILAGGRWDRLEPGQAFDLPAAAFFHAGYTDRRTGEVGFDPAYDPADAIFYGPRLPVPAGRYQVRVDLASEAPPGTLLGHLRLRESREGDPGPVPALAGQAVSVEFRHHLHGPFTLEFRYTRAAPLRIRSVRIERVE